MKNSSLVGESTFATHLAKKFAISAFRLGEKAAKDVRVKKEKKIGTFRFFVSLRNRETTYEGNEG